MMLGFMLVASILFFIVGSLFAFVVLFILNRKREPRPKITRLIAVAITCAATPFVCLILMVAISNLLQKSDTQLYEEIFGYRSKITEDRMLFNDSGSGRDREIFMRAQPTDAERKTLLAIPGLVKSQLTPDQFSARGKQHFSWWVSAKASDYEYCKSLQIYDAHGFKGWAKLYIAECVDAGDTFPASTNLGEFHVIASHRQH
jgi:hypothetical protein